MAAYACRKGKLDQNVARLFAGADPTSVADAAEGGRSSRPSILGSGTTGELVLGNCCKIDSPTMSDILAACVSDR
jgi:hypothetical protein